MIILGVETSCDDTGIAIVQASPAPPRRGGGGIPKFKILSNIVSSQVELHKKYGGVYPTLAKREHQRNLVPVLEEALKGAKLLKKLPKNKNQVISRSRDYSTNLNSILEREPELLKNLLSFLKKYEKPNIDLIAVTNGPGLEPCLWLGINFAKALAFVWGLPIVPVNHIEAHILANFVGENPKSAGREADSPEGCIRNSKQNIFPAVCLVVSGGHTQLILMKDFGNYKIIGETKDDAAGECFDKTARILGLGYPGGPAIAKQASQLRERLRNQESVIGLPRPMINQKNYDFSFSGLKTAVLYEHKKQPKKVQKSPEYISEMSKEIQQAIIDVLIKKTIKAGKDFRVKTIILGGGVTANKELRKQLGEKIQKELSNIQYLIPSIQLATDNAVMTGVTGYFYKPRKIESIEAEANLRLK